MKRFILQVLLVVSFSLVTLIVSSETLYASRFVYTVIAMDETYTVHAMTARDTFGRNAASLSQFAAAFPNRGDDTIVFNAQYFVTATWNPVGALVSQGRVVSGAPYPWLSWGAGFTDYNRFGLFQGGIYDNRMYFHGRRGIPPYVTAFNPYPHLVVNGVRATLTPMPGMDAAALASSAVRGFAGQRADGSFLVGSVGGTNMFQLQEIAVGLGLVNAVNLDGGASAGMWRNGTYIVAPGRQLPAVILITNNRPEGLQVADPEPIATHVVFYSNIDYEGHELVYVRGVNFAHINTLIAMGFQFDALEWALNPERLNMTWGEQVLEMVVGSRSFNVNNEQFTHNISPFFMDGRQHMVMVPIVSLFESLGYSLEWDESLGLLVVHPAI